MRVNTAIKRLAKSRYTYWVNRIAAWLRNPPRTENYRPVKFVRICRLDHNSGFIEVGPPAKARYYVVGSDLPRRVHEWWLSSPRGPTDPRPTQGGHSPQVLCAARRIAVIEAFCVVNGKPFDPKGKKRRIATRNPERAFRAGTSDATNEYFGSGYISEKFEPQAHVHRVTQRGYHVHMGGERL